MNVSRILTKKAAKVTCYFFRFWLFWVQYVCNCIDIRLFWSELVLILKLFSWIISGLDWLKRPSNVFLPNTLTYMSVFGMNLTMWFPLAKTMRFSSWPMWCWRQTRPEPHVPKTLVSSRMSSVDTKTTPLGKSTLRKASVLKVSIFFFSLIYKFFGARVLLWGAQYSILYSSLYWLSCIPHFLM